MRKRFRGQSTFFHEFAIYATGLGTSGQLGICRRPPNETSQDEDSPIHDDQVNAPVGIPHSAFNFERVESIGCGWYHSVVTTHEGSIFTCGAGYSHQSGHPLTTNVRFFKQLNPPSTSEGSSIKGNIKQVSCGGHHTLVVTDLGRVYSFGEGREGQLGTGVKISSSCSAEVLVLEKNDQTGKLQQVRFDSVSAGGYHSILIDDQSSIWTFGKNSYGRMSLCKSDNVELGLGDPMLFPEEHILKPQCVERVSSVQSNLRESFSFKMAAAGAWHSIFLTKDGLVFGSGDTQYGQLGIVHYVDEYQQHQLAAQSATMHQSRKNSNNAVMCMQSTSTAPHSPSHYSQSGHSFHPSSVKSRYFIPEWISTLQNYVIKQIAAGYFHTVFVDIMGRVFTCGWASYGQTGHGSNQSERLPRQIETLSMVPIRYATCGWNNVLLVDEQGKCFAFGESKHGQLGIVDEHGNCVKQVETPILVKELQSVPIRQVAAGRGHSLFLAGCTDTQPYEFTRHAYCDVVLLIE